MDNTLPDMCYTYLSGANEIGLIKKGEKGYYKTEYLCGDDTEINEDLVRELNAKLGVGTLELTCMEIGSRFGFDVPGAYKENYDDEEIEQLESKNHIWAKYLGDYIRNDLKATQFDYDYIAVAAEEAHLNAGDLVYLKVVTREEAAKMWEMKPEDIKTPEPPGEGYWKARLQEYVMNDYKSTSVEYVKSALDQAGISERDRFKINPELSEKKKKSSKAGKALSL